MSSSPYDNRVKDVWVKFEGSKALYDMIQHQIATTIEMANRGAQPKSHLSPPYQSSPFLSSGAAHHTAHHARNEEIKNSFAQGFRRLSKQSQRKESVAAAARRVQSKHKK